MLKKFLFIIFDVLEVSLIQSSLLYFGIGYLRLNERKENVFSLKHSYFQRQNFRVALICLLELFDTERGK